MLGSIDSLWTLPPSLRGKDVIDHLWTRAGVQDVSSKGNTGDCRPSASIWQTIGNVVATTAVTTLVYSGVRSALSMYLWKRSLRMCDSGEAAPGPAPIPLLGNMLALRANYYKTLYEHVTEPASVFWVMSTPFVVVNDSDAAARVLGGEGGLYLKPKYFGYRSKPLQRSVDKQQAQVMSESAEYNADNDASRAALQKMIDSSFDDIKLAMDELMGRLAKESVECTAGKRDALCCVRESIIGLNLQVLFGLRYAGREKGTQLIAEMIGFAGIEFAQRMVNPLNVLYAWGSNMRYIRDVMGLIQLGRELCSAPDKALAVQDENTSLGWVHAWVGKVGKIGKLGKLTGLLMASSQTVPLTAVWMLHLIAKHAETRGKIKHELQRLGIISVADLCFDDLEKMMVVDAVIKETLRLYPPFPLIQREAQEDVVLGGITIPRGTPVYIVPWLLHRNPDFWSDPHSFKPSRFLQFCKDIGDSWSSWVYLPFGRGSRMCAGSRLALTELKVLLAITVLHYDVDTSASAEVLNSIYPPLGMVPHGIDLVVKKSSFCCSIGNITGRIRQALDEGKIIVIASDRDDTLGLTPATMEDQFDVIGNMTVHHLKQIDDDSRAHVAIVTGRRPSEIRMETDLRVYGTTGSFLVERGDEHGSCLVDLPSNFEEMSRKLKGIAESQADFLSHDDTQNKISIRFKGDRGYEAALAAITIDDDVGCQDDFILKKYLVYDLIELLPHACEKGAAIDDMYRKVDSPYFVYFGNGKNDVSAAERIKNYYDGFVIKIGNGRVHELAAQADYFLPTCDSSRALLSEICKLLQKYRGASTVSDVTSNGKELLLST